MRGLVQVWYIKSAFIILFVGLFYFYNYWAALRAKPNQKIEAASSVLKKDKMADRSGFPSPLPCVVANLLIFEEKRCVILGKNCGKGTKILFCLKLLVLSYRLKNRKNWLHSKPLVKSSFHLSPVPSVLSVTTVKEPVLKRISGHHFILRRDDRSRLNQVEEGNSCLETGPQQWSIRIHIHTSFTVGPHWKMIVSVFGTDRSVNSKRNERLVMK